MRNKAQEERLDYLLRAFKEDSWRYREIGRASCRERV